MTKEELKQKYPEVFEAFAELDRLQRVYECVQKIRQTLDNEKPCTQENEKENEQPIS